MVYKLVNWKRRDGVTPLLKSTRNVEIMSILINACKNEKEVKKIINARDKEGTTPLIMSSMYGRLASIKYLVKQKEIDFFAKDNKGWTALHWASWANEGTLQITKEILERVEGEKEKEKLVKMENNFGSTAKQLADEKGRKDIALYLSEWDL